MKLPLLMMVEGGGVESISPFLFVKTKTKSNKIMHCMDLFFKWRNAMTVFLPSYW